MLLIIIQFLISIKISTQYLEYNIYRDENKFENNPYITLSIGFPPQKIEFVFDTTKTFVCIIDSSLKEKSTSFFNHSLSKSIKPRSTSSAIIFNDGKISGKDYIDFINTDMSVPFTFLLMDEITTDKGGFDNFIGIKMIGDKKIANYENRHLINILYDHKAIEQRMFALTPDKMYLGGIPEKIKKKIKYSCKNTQGKVTDWNCFLLDIKIGNTSFISEGGIASHIAPMGKFMTRKRGIYAPESFGLPILSYYLEYEIIKNNCKLIKSKNFLGTGNRIECSTHSDLFLIDDLPGLNISFQNGLSVFLPPEKLFFKNYKKPGTVNFVLEYWNDFDYFYFGNSVLEDLLVIFDMDTQTISFAINSEVSHENQQKPSPNIKYIFLKKLLTVLLFVVSFGIFELLLQKHLIL